jgi:hypothetical protein
MPTKNKTVMAALKSVNFLYYYDHATVTWKHSGFISEADLKKTTNRPTMLSKIHYNF